MIKSLVLAAVTGAGALGATSAQADVSWSVNVNTPVVGTAISGGSGYYVRGYRQGVRRMYVPAPVYVPAQAYRAYPPIAYHPPAVVYRSVPVVYPLYYPNHRPNDRAGWHHAHERWDGHGRR